MGDPVIKSDTVQAPKPEELPWKESPVAAGPREEKPPMPFLRFGIGGLMGFSDAGTNYGMRFDLQLNTDLKLAPKLGPLTLPFVFQPRTQVELGNVIQSGGAGISILTPAPDLLAVYASAVVSLNRSRMATDVTLDPVIGVQFLYKGAWRFMFYGELTLPSINLWSSQGDGNGKTFAGSLGLRF